MAAQNEPAQHQTLCCWCRMHGMAEGLNAVQRMAHLPIPRQGICQLLFGAELHEGALGLLGVMVLQDVDVLNLQQM